MLLYPNCKINLGLRVLNKRPDGYHNLSSIFYPVYGLADELEVTLSDTFRFETDGIVVDCPPEDNLIIRCYNRMRAAFPAIGPVRIRFVKRIPFGAGLGGGSSDAAHMAIALNTLFHLHLNQEQLIEQVRPLGADCPFFIHNVPCYAEGIGDELTPVSLDLSHYRLVMIKPPVAVSTKQAYAGISLHPHGRMLTPEQLSAPVHLHREWVNDFEQTIFALHPTLAQIKQHLLQAGAAYAAMSGSGSTLFGLFELDAHGGTHADLRSLHEQFTSMVIFDDTLTQTQP